MLDLVESRELQVEYGADFSAELANDSDIVGKLDTDFSSHSGLVRKIAYSGST